MHGRLVALVVACFALAASPSPAQISPITHQPAPIVACFAEGTDPAYVERIHTYVELHNQLFYAADYNLGSRWSGSQGTPRTLSWSLVPDTVFIPGGIGEPSSNSNLFATMDSGFAAQGGRATWVNRFQQVFDRWSALTGITYVRITAPGQDWDDGASWGSSGSSTRGDIRIGMHFIDGGSGVLAYNSFPPGGDMVLDSGDINNFASSSNQNRFLRNTIAHEHGHGIGIAHVCTNNSSQLMEPFLSSAFDGPQQDDIRAGQRHYGDPHELNESFGAARPLGTLNPSGSLTLGTIPAPPTGGNDPFAALLSIDADGRSDWFWFSAASAMSATITVTPIGSTYESNTQNSNGSCNSGLSVNALAVADLAVTLYASNGTTVIAGAASAGAGLAETISNAPLTTGAHYLRVYETNAPAQTQLYRITITSVCSGPVITQHPSQPQVEVGQPMELTAAATGATSVRWRKNGVPLTDDGRITGSTTTTLQIDPTVMNDSGEYDFTATNACSTAISNPVNVVIACYPNCDGSTFPPVVNVADFACFLTRYAAGEPYANCDGSTTEPVLNVADFGCFLTRFAAGCP
ncbi:MAG: immunoglobulin domain-containing protein [Phycisphaerales bacterium]